MQPGPKQLLDWMRRRSFNQTEAAEYLDLHGAEVSMYLNGRRTPGLAMAVQIERRTGIPVEAWMLTAVDGSSGRGSEPVGIERSNKA